VLVKPAVVNYLDVIAVDAADPLIQHAAVLFVVVGALVFLVGFVGCCGAYHENQRLLFFVSAHIAWCFQFILFFCTFDASVMLQCLVGVVTVHTGTPPAADWKRPPGRPRRTWLQ